MCRRYNPNYEQLELAVMKEMVMLTGDNEKTAALMAKKSKVTRYFANLLPEDKVTSIRKLQQEGHQTAIIGDGKTMRRHSQLQT